MKSIIRHSFAAACCAATLVVAGCGKATPDTATKGTIRLAYVNWSEGVAVTHLLAVLLGDMGYQVETTMADVAPIYTAVAEGQQDVLVETWLPTTHKAYDEQYGDKLEFISTWFKDAKIGLVVPAYVDIDSIEQLGSARDRFKGRITGIDAGAGVMSCAEQAIQDYGLDYELIASSGPAMTAALKGAIDKGDWIVVTGWAPHWKFARYDLKFLEDPKGVFGGSEIVQAAARRGFSAEFPEVAAFFKKMTFDAAQIGSLMDAVENATAGEEAAVRAWIAANQALVDGWLK